MTRPSTAEPAARGRRADATRNVSALVDAAKAVFATSGVDAPAKEITDRAGVGVGTLYRHFPRRSDLIVAVMEHEIDVWVEMAEILTSTLAPWDALVAWTERFTDFVGTKQGLASALHSDDPAYDGLPERLLARLLPVLQALLDRTPGLDRDLVARDILVTVSMICQPVRGQDRNFNQRMVGVFVNGLRKD